MRAILVQLIVLFTISVQLDAKVIWLKQLAQLGGRPKKANERKFVVKVSPNNKPKDITQDEVVVFHKVLKELTNRLQNELKFNQQSSNTSKRVQVDCLAAQPDGNSKRQGVILPMTSQLEDLTVLSLLYEEIGFWSRCTRSCKSRRARKCRLPGLCSVDFLIEEAHCYSPGSKCEKKVMKELGMENKKENRYDDEDHYEENHEDHGNYDHNHEDEYNHHDNEDHYHSHEHNYDYHNEHQHDYDSDHSHDYGSHHDHSNDYGQDPSYSPDYGHHHNEIDDDYVTFSDYNIFEQEDYPDYTYGDPDVHYHSQDYDDHHHEEEDDHHEDHSHEHVEDEDVSVEATDTEPQVCGKSKVSVPYESFRIIGGREAIKGAWPWQVALVNRWGEIFCGGTIISGRWVLTAAHCVRRKLSVRIADHDISRHDGEVQLKVKKSFRHPEYDNEIIDSDLALLQLPVDVFQAVKTSVKKACLPPRQERLSTEKSCVVLGWGKERESHIFGSDVLMFAKVPIVGMDQCHDAYPDHTMTKNMFCAGYLRGGADSCEGDSGGPLLCQNEHKQWVVEGVTSFGEGCGEKGKLGVYVKVTNYLDWINETISNN